MQPHLYAVAVGHAPKDCPLQQQSPDWALTLAENLRHNPTIGAFSMQLHIGLALVESADTAEAVAKIFQQVLPHHLDPQVADVTGNAELQKFYADPQLLDAEKLRHELFAAVDDIFPDKGFKRTEQEKRPSLPLSSANGPALPAYLEEHAPTPVPANA